MPEPSEGAIRGTRVDETVRFVNRRVSVAQRWCLPRGCVKSTSVPQFHVADLTPQGDLRATQPYDYSTLERLPGCSDMMASFSNHLYRETEGFECALTSGQADEAVRFRWHASADTAGIATVWADKQLASLSILASGIAPEADVITLNAFQRRITQELHETEFEPAFGLLQLPQRPLVATMTLFSPATDIARLLVALADRCFAASYFRYHRLV